MKKFCFASLSGLLFCCVLPLFEAECSSSAGAGKKTPAVSGCDWSNDILFQDSSGGSSYSPAPRRVQTVPFPPVYTCGKVTACVKEESEKPPRRTFRKIREGEKKRNAKRVKAPRPRIRTKGTSSCSRRVQSSPCLNKLIRSCGK